MNHGPIDRFRWRHRRKRVAEIHINKRDAARLRFGWVEAQLEATFRLLHLTKLKTG